MKMSSALISSLILIYFVVVVCLCWYVSVDYPEASSLTEAVLHETQADSTAIDLYLTIKDVKVKYCTHLGMQLSINLI